MMQNLNKKMYQIIMPRYFRKYNVLPEVTPIDKHYHYYDGSLFELSYDAVIHKND